MVLDMWNRKHTNPDRENKRKPLRWILIDSIIIGLITMCATMPEAIPSPTQLWIMFKAFLVAFVFQLAVERGLKRGD